MHSFISAVLFTFASTCSFHVHRPLHIYYKMTIKNRLKIHLNGQIVFTNIGITEYNRQVPWCSDKRSYTVVWKHNVEIIYTIATLIFVLINIVIGHVCMNKTVVLSNSSALKRSMSHNY